ncbi:XAF1 factor, partial [Atractosteus spatula]|nr:XAF1 factor [Atractosteus spatula]
MKIYRSEIPVASELHWPVNLQQLRADFLLIVGSLFPGALPAGMPESCWIALPLMCPPNGTSKSTSLENKTHLTDSDIRTNGLSVQGLAVTLQNETAVFLHDTNTRAPEGTDSSLKPRPQGRLPYLPAFVFSRQKIMFGWQFGGRGPAEIFSGFSFCSREVKEKQSSCADMEEHKGDSRLCRNCKKEVAVSNFALHESHCKRFLCVCPDCDEPVPREQMDQHRDTEHKQVRCPQCHEQMEKRQLEEHQAEQCQERLASCQFCQLQVPLSRLPEHVAPCGSRTERCPDCGSYVQLRDQEAHTRDCPPPPPLAQPVRGASHAKSESAPVSGRSSRVPPA